MLQGVTLNTYVNTSWKFWHTFFFFNCVQGVTFEAGDVVSVLDVDGGVYYGVAQGFLLDQYAHKFVLLTWLLPKLPNPMQFDPAMFILGR